MSAAEASAAEAAFGERLRQRQAAGEVAPLEQAMAEWCLRHGGGRATALAMLWVVRALDEGHTCLPEARIPARLPGDEAPEMEGAALRKALTQSPLVGGPGASLPLIRDGGRLYLQRYWAHEARLAQRLRELADQPAQPVDLARVGPEGDLFDHGDVAPGEPHWQAVAAAVAMRHRLAVISGGPGTGKTYTVLRLMRFLVESADAAGEAAPVIRLAAPTGKAAARMMASVREGLPGLPGEERLRACLPEEALTLHRLLGMRPGTTQARYDAGRPLAADVVIVDEASMIDLPLMGRLAEAIPPSGRLVLLGDRYQLASVESGAVLAELCAAGGVNRPSAEQRKALAPLLGWVAEGRGSAAGEASAAAAQGAAVPEPGAEAGGGEGGLPLADHVVTLQVSRRFRPNSGIGRLAAAINAGDREGALAVVRGESGSGRGDAGSSAGNGDGGASGGAAVEADRGPAGEGEPEVIGELDGPRPAERAARALVAAYRPLAEAQEPAEALQILERVRLLTATRVGPCGSIALNQAIEAQLAEEAGRDPQRRWYHGRPVLVLSNDYRAGLLNGDLGVCLADPQGRLRVWIPSTEGLRSFLPASLPEHQPAYAMTVHKSQGSEVDHAHILLPERDMPLITRELLYTAVTRARQRVTLYGPASVIAQGVARPTERMSSLAERLRGAG